MTRFDTNISEDFAMTTWDDRERPSAPALDEPYDSWTLPQNISESERWGSMAVGALMLLAGLSRGRGSGLLLGLAGGALLYRGYTGHCHAYEALGVNTAERNPATGVPAQEGVKVEHSIALNVPTEQLFSFWRDVENLPRVMRHLKRVEAIDRQRSHWVAEGPMGVSVEWDAEIINERDNELIAWRSLPGGNIDTAGSVHFQPLGEGRGTAIHVSMKYNPPGGKIGAAVASLLGSGLERQIRDDLHRFKSVMEAGEWPSTDGQPRGGA
jgi:uncharacterized membrane protein